MQPNAAAEPFGAGMLARHPLDPEPVRDTKASMVLVLGVVALFTGFFLAGLVPASLALLLARQARREMADARGFLTGARRLRTGVALAWLGVLLAGAGIVTAVIVVLLHMADAAGARNYPANVN